MEEEKEFITAPSYRDWETIGTPLVKNGKMYTKVKRKCDRCVNGVYVCRVENGRPVPHPVADGVCFQCGGTGYEVKEVRLYTVAEAAKMEQRNEAARIKRQQELEARMKTEYTEKKVKWLKDNGWSQDGVTYIVTGDSFSIKDDLKAAGWLFDYVLRWHKADPTGYEDRVKKVEIDKVIEFSAWGEGHYLTEAKDYIDNLLTEDTEETVFGEDIGEKVENKEVIIKDIFGFFSRYGWSNVYKFKCDNIIYVWMTKTSLDFEKGDTVFLSGTVKSHTIYKGENQTTLTRCQVKNNGKSY